MFSRRPPNAEADQQHPPAFKATSQQLASPLGPALRTEAINVPPAARPIETSPEEGLVTIGKGTRVTGNIGHCKKLDVYGVLEADVIAETLIVRAGGGVKGSIESDNAEIHGVVEGELTAHEHLDLRSTSEVSGDVAYRTISIEKGARLLGTLRYHQVPDVEQPAEPPEPSAHIVRLDTFQAGQTQADDAVDNADRSQFRFNGHGGHSGPDASS